ncbi:MAG TPA: hypothetical protein VH209_16540 [Steroidobacteraceae bacterium]|nr:hypothetical protein [Steroidobacteraceae bacterium]
MFLAGHAVAEPIGVVTDSTGPLLAKTASGSIKVLVVGSSVELSDTLVSRTSAYARVALTDHTLVALGPDTELALDKYSFHEKASPTQENAPGAPGPDEAVLVLARGRVRVTSGILGTRHADSFTLRAGTAVIDIGHSTFIAEYRQPSPGQLARVDIMSPPARRAPVLGLGHSGGKYTYVQLQTFDSLRLAQSTLPSVPPPSGLNPGLYVQVLDGLIKVSNSGGSTNFSAGQFGFTPTANQPPVIVPKNPGIQFTPPPAFSAPPAISGASTPPKSGTVDCVVR